MSGLQTCKVERRAGNQRSNQEDNAMSTHTFLVLFGALLLLAGIVGGGLSLKEITIPALN